MPARMAPASCGIVVHRPFADSLRQVNWRSYPRVFVGVACSRPRPVLMGCLGSYGVHGQEPGPSEARAEP